MFKTEAINIFGELKYFLTCEDVNLTIVRYHIEISFMQMYMFHTLGTLNTEKLENKIIERENNA